jgi:hypothetical protein
MSPPLIPFAFAQVHRKLRNACRFMLGNLHDYHPTANAPPPSALRSIDRHALAALAAFSDRAHAHYERLDTTRLVTDSLQLASVELSAGYFDSVRDRLYCAPVDSSSRRAAQYVLSHALDTLSMAIAPVLPFLVEELHTHRQAAFATAESSAAAGVAASSGLQMQTRVEDLHTHRHAASATATPLAAGATPLSAPRGDGYNVDLPLTPPPTPSLHPAPPPPASPGPFDSTPAPPASPGPFERVWSDPPPEWRDEALLQKWALVCAARDEATKLAHEAVLSKRLSSLGEARVEMLAALDGPLHAALVSAGSELNDVLLCCASRVASLPTEMYLHKESPAIGLRPLPTEVDLHTLMRTPPPATGLRPLPAEADIHTTPPATGLMLAQAVVALGGAGGEETICVRIYAPDESIGKCPRCWRHVHGRAVSGEGVELEDGWTYRGCPSDGAAGMCFASQMERRAAAPLEPVL